MTTSLRSKTTIDLIISTEHEYSADCQQLPYYGSDHLPILTEFSNINLTNQDHFISKTNWNLYRTILSVLGSEIKEINHFNHVIDSHPFKWFEFFQQFLHALRIRATTWHKITRRRPTISQALQVMLNHKHYLQNRYRHNKNEENRLSLRSWNKIIQREFKQHRVNSWNQFIDNIASPNLKTFWKTIKILNKKRSVEFSAITESNTILKTPDQILPCLTQHFQSRFAPPSTDPNLKTDKDALDL
jgi:hypothetical protein